MRQLLTSKGAGESNAVHITGPVDLNSPAPSEMVETSPTTVPVTAHSEAVELASPSVAENSCVQHRSSAVFEVRRSESEESASAEESQQTEGKKSRAEKGERGDRQCEQFILSVSDL